MFKISTKWLSKLTKTELDSIARDYRNESKDTFIEGVLNSIKKPNKGLWVIAFVLGVVLLILIDDLPYFNLTPLTKELALDLLNDRLGNLIAIFSISIAISVFIVNAIQSKKSSEDQSSVIFEESYLYPIIYFILTSILIYSGVTYFKDVKFVSDNAIIRLSILFLIIFWVSLFLIAFLFIRIYKFLNTSILYNKYLIRIQKLIEEDFLIELSQRISRKIYVEEINDGNILKKIDLFFPKDLPNLTPITLGNADVVEIEDVNMAKLKKGIRVYLVKNENLSFKGIGISDKIYTDTILFNCSEDIVDKFKTVVLKAIKVKKIIRKKQKKSEKLHIEFERLRYGLIFNVKNENVVDVENILEKYKLIIEKFATLLDVFQIEKKQEHYPPESFFNQEWKLIYDINTHIYPAFEKAIQINNREILLEISGHIYSILMIATQKKSVIIFNKYRTLFDLFYRESFQSEYYQSLIANRISHFIVELIEYSVLYNYRNTTSYKDKIDYFKFFNLSLNIAAQFFKALIDKLDYKGFKHFLNLYDSILSSTESIESDKLNIRETDNLDLSKSTKKLDSELNWLSKYLLYGIYGWLLYSFIENRISKEAFLEFNKIFKLPHISFQDNLKQFELSISQDNDYFGWGYWGNEERWTSRKVFSPITPNNWLPLVFFINILKFDLVDIGNLDVKKINTIDELLLKRIDYFEQNIISKPGLLSAVLPGLDKDILKSNVSSLKVLLMQIIDKQKVLIREEIIKQELSEQKIRNFKDETIKVWRESDNFRGLFYRFGNYRIISKEDKSMELKVLQGLNSYFVNWRKLFVENHSEDISGISNSGNMVYQEEEFFLRKIYDLNIQRVEYNSIQDAFNEILSKRKEINEANMIFISSKIFHENYQYFVSRDDFEHYWELPEDLAKFNFNGRIKDIFILSVDNVFLPSSIIFCNFEKCFEMIIRENQEKIDNMLDIDVKDLSTEKISQEIQKIKNSKVEDWMLDSNGDMKSDKELELVLRNSIEIRIFETIEFLVKDKDLIDIAVIKN